MTYQFALRVKSEGVQSASYGSQEKNWPMCRNLS